MKKKNDLVTINLSDNTNSIDKKSIEFVDTLIRLTENKALRWTEMDVDKYNELSDSVKEKVKKFRSNKTLSSMETAASILANYQKTIIQQNTIEKKIFYVHSSNNIIICFIRQIDYYFAFPVTDYSLELISDNDDPSKCYVHETEFADPDVKKETLKRLGEVILPDIWDSNTSNQVMSFMDDVINGNVKFDK